MELSRNLVTESVARLKPTAAHTLDVALTVAQAVDRMRAERVGCLLVTRAGVLAGIFTERDLLVRVLAGNGKLNVPLDQVMTADPVTVTLLDPVRTAVQRMQDGGYRHLPVVDESGRPVGILSAKRVVHYIVEHVPAVVYTHPPGPPAPPWPPERFGP